MRRAFRIWRCPQCPAWLWECTLCDPPAFGCRTTPDAWERIITISMRYHLRRRRDHHDYVRAYRRQPGPRRAVRAAAATHAHGYTRRWGGHGQGPQETVQRRHAVDVW